MQIYLHIYYCSGIHIAAFRHTRPQSPPLSKWDLVNMKLPERGAFPNSLQKFACLILNLEIKKEPANIVTPPSTW